MRGSPSSWVRPTCRIGAAVHSVRAVDPESVARLRRGRTTGAASPRPRLRTARRRTPTASLPADARRPSLLDSAGALSARFTAVHATHVTAADIARLADHRSRCCICPTTERELADGIGPTAALRDAGVELCVGSDSHAVIDPFEETRAVELDERLASLRRGTHRPARPADRSHRGSDTRASAGQTVARCKPARLADFVTVSFDSPRLAGSDRLADPLAALLFAAAPADVRSRRRRRRCRRRDGVHQRVDVVAALERSISDAWAAVR